MKKGWYWFYKELKLDSVGKKVLKASELLAKHGSKLKPTNTFTLAMRSAVVAFQKKKWIRSNGYH